MLSFINNHRKLVLLFVGIILIISFVVIFVLPKQTNNPLPGATPTDPWSTFLPGQTTKEQVVQQLGNPVTQTSQNNQTIDEFKSNSPTRNHQVVFTNDTSQFFKQIIASGDTTKMNDLVNKYGTTSTILYGPDQSAGFYLYVYLSKGVAYLANASTGDVLEIWYFPSSNLQDFISKWASNYSINQDQQSQ